MIALEVSDTISALDLVERLRGYGAHAAAQGGDVQEVVVETVRKENLRHVLGVIDEWAGVYGLESVSIRLDRSTYELRLHRSGLAWRDVT